MHTDNQVWSGGSSGGGDNSAELLHNCREGQAAGGHMIDDGLSAHLRSGISAENPAGKFHRILELG